MPSYFGAYGQGPLPAPAGAVALNVPNDPLEFARFATMNTQNPEDIYQPIYDRVNYAAAGAFELIFFSNPVGASQTLIRAGVAASVIKTRRDTNLENQGVFPAKAFQVWGISFTIVPLQNVPTAAATDNIPDDYSILVDGGYFQFTLVDRPFLYLPLSLVDWHYFGGAAATTLNATTLMSPLKSDVFPIEPKLTVAPNQNFSARMQFDGSPAVTQSCDLVVCLHAFMRRPS